MPLKANAKSLIISSIADDVFTPLLNGGIPGRIMGKKLAAYPSTEAAFISQVDAIVIKNIEAL